MWLGELWGAGVRQAEKDGVLAVVGIRKSTSLRDKNEFHFLTGPGGPGMVEASLFTLF